MFRWIFDPANAVQVSALGFLVGIMGIALSLIGFGLTGWQLWRTANATKAAAEAVANIKSRVATYDAVFEISRATSALRETEKYLRKQSWSEAVDSYAVFRHAVVRLSELPSAISNDGRENLKKMLRGATSLSDKLERSVLLGNDPSDVAKAITSNKKFMESLTVIGVHLEGAQ